MRPLPWLASSGKRGFSWGLPSQFRMKVVLSCDPSSLVPSISGASIMRRPSTAVSIALMVCIIGKSVPGGMRASLACGCS